MMVLDGYGTVVTSLGMRVKHHFPQICDTLNERLPSQSEKVRKQPADLISRIVVVMKQCEMDQELCDFCTLFFNRLEQEYQEVLDSFLELN
jgi:splicing factor 3B subunit 1